MLIKYVRNKEKQRIGVVVAIDKHRIGWSKCNFSMGDKFDKERGKFIAQKRAEKYPHDFATAALIYDNNQKVYCPITDHLFLKEHPKMAQEVRKDFFDMVERANRYFKD